MTSTSNEQTDREDGEIIEDEFEDISDNSIISPAIIPSKEYIPETCLSSISEVEVIEKFKHRCHMRRRRKPHRKRKYHHRSFCINSENDEYVELDRKLLRAAIHIDKQESLRNSLHTRLKAMTSIERQASIQTPIQNQTEIISSDEGDDDLIQLRLEALRTAVLNKVKHRKNNKCKEISKRDELDVMFSDFSEKVDKENSIASNDHKPSHITKNYVEQSSEALRNGDSDTHDISPQEEDEDVLRALLLASLSKKISEDNQMINIDLQSSNTISLPSKQINKKVKLNTWNSISANKINFPVKQHSKVQPIIININCDSESEEEFKNKSSQISQKNSDLAIENTVENFLKEQRAKVEAVNNINKDVKSDIFNNSALKLLPKFKQIEYYNLLKKLEDAQKLKQKKKLKQNFSLQSASSIPVLNEDQMRKNFTKKLIRCKDFNSKSPPNVDKIPDLKNEVQILRSVLKGIQIQKSEK